MPAINSNRLRLQTKIMAKKNLNKTKLVNGVRLNQKISVNLKRRVKIKKIKSNSILFQQKKIRGHFESIRTKLNLKKARGVGNGVDYLYHYNKGKEKKSLKLDLKFSFGALGENSIKVRLINRKLFNGADWAIVVGKNKEISFFSIKKLEKYVRENYGSVSGKLVNKGTHFESMVNLSDFYLRTKTKPINAEMNAISIQKALDKILVEENNFIPKKIQLNQKTKFVSPIKKVNKINLNRNNRNIKYQKPINNGFFVLRPTMRNK